MAGLPGCAAGRVGFSEGAVGFGGILFAGALADTSSTVGVVVDGRSLVEQSRNLPPGV